MNELTTPHEAVENERLGSPFRIARTRRLLATKWSSVVAIPYTSRISGIGPDGNPIVEKDLPSTALRLGRFQIEGKLFDAKLAKDAKNPTHVRRADVVLSSYSAMVTEATRMVHNWQSADQVISLGEYTFGPQNPSTAQRITEQLTVNPRRHMIDPAQWQNPEPPPHKRPVPKKAITQQDGLEDTDQQIEYLKTLTRDTQKAPLLEKPLYVVMDFHKARVKQVLGQNGLPGQVLSAEDIFMEHFRRDYSSLATNDPEQYKRVLQEHGISLDDPTHFDALLALHRDRLEQFTKDRIRWVETGIRALSKLGTLRKPALSVLRTVRGGGTVTDYHYMGPAEGPFGGQRKKARDALKNGKLKQGTFIS